LKFVKYVSRAAWGGRWDITSEWAIKEDEEGDDENGAEGEDPEKPDGENEENALEEKEEWMGIPS